MCSRKANSLYIMETDITSTRPTGLQALMYRELPLASARAAVSAPIEGTVETNSAGQTHGSGWLNPDLIEAIGVMECTVMC